MLSSTTTACAFYRCRRWFGFDCIDEVEAIPIAHPIAVEALGQTIANHAPPFTMLAYFLMCFCVCHVARSFVSSAPLIVEHV
jgi:hypothetical protein